MNLSTKIKKGGLWLPRGVYKTLTGRTRDVLFLWVPKCAGTSTYQTLVKHGCIEDRWLDPMRRFRNRGVSTFSHVDVVGLVEEGVIRKAYFDNAFKFAFVRNPYDRAVSLFAYLKKLKFPEVPEAMTFTEFCLTLERGAYPPVGLYNYKGLSQCNLMLSWITDRSGKIIADFVGRYETLQKDFQTVCDTIGIKETIPHENKTEHRPYQEYFDPRTRAIIEKVYRKDLDAFGYSFD
ncbi:MAG: sulfotransferase family 2 domain-containing protein [Opitutaceae bacterium]|nr:sulfotransferase family 2 domain-containing protein [Verrucomicrobiales bacterium]